TEIYTTIIYDQAGNLKQFLCLNVKQGCLCHSRAGGNLSFMDKYALLIQRRAIFPWEIDHPEEAA
ncbi:MAG: hypothetical protein ACK58T_23255, partial [Phycisphaerae bacterium]